MAQGAVKSSVWILWTIGWIFKLRKSGEFIDQGNN